MVFFEEAAAQELINKLLEEDGTAGRRSKRSRRMRRPRRWRRTTRRRRGLRLWSMTMTNLTLRWRRRWLRKVDEFV